MLGIARPPVWMLDEGSMDRLEDAVFRMLERVGYRVEHHEILRWLDRDGAQVDYDAQIARFPLRMVEDLLESLPADRSTAQGAEETTLAKSPPPLRFSMGGSCQHFYDWERRERRRPTEADLIECLKAGEALESVASVSVPVSYGNGGLIERLNALALMLRHTSKGAAFEVFDLPLLKYFVEIGEIIGGPQGRTRYLPGGVFVTSPCWIGRELADFLLEVARYGAPRGRIGTMPVAGLNAPVTVAGTAVVAAADIIGGWLVLRAISPEVCVGGGSACSGIVDLRTACASFSAPEAIQASVAVSQLFRKRFGSRAGIGVCALDYVDAQAPGIQATFERMYRTLAVAAGTGAQAWPLGFGRIDSGNTWCPVQAMLDMEFSAAVRELSKPVEVTEETIGLEAIETAGPGAGTFMTDEHTLTHWRASQWVPQILKRGSWDRNEEHGILDRAQENWRAAVASWQPPVIEDDKLRAIDGVLGRARVEFLTS